MRRPSTQIFRGVIAGAKRKQIILPTIIYTSPVYTASQVIPLNTGSYQVGDLLFVTASGNTDVAFAGKIAFPSLYYNASSRQSAGYKFLTSTDIADSISISVPSVGNFVFTIVRNVTSITQRGSIISGGSTGIITGFTKDSNSKMFLLAAGDRDPSTLPTTAGFTNLASGISTYFSTNLSYMNSSTYTGSNIVVSLVNSAYSGAAAIYELT